MPRECLPIRKEALPLSGLLFPTTKNRGVGMKEEDGRQPVLKRYRDSVSGDPDVQRGAELSHSYQLHSEVWVCGKSVNCHRNLCARIHAHKHKVAVSF